MEATPGLKIVEGAYTIEDYCVGVDEGNTALLEAVNKALNEMIDDGTVEEIMVSISAVEPAHSFRGEGRQGRPSCGVLLRKGRREIAHGSGTDL